jgi:NADPH-dependent 2,4-dienoyl-CoA reductase/sulfur reductase-like enzyme
MDKKTGFEQSEKLILSEKMENKYDLVVIGGGPAGITLSKRLAKTMKMAIIRPEDYSMIYCAMPYVIEDLINKQKCFKKDELVTETGAQLIRDKVVNIDFDLKCIKLEKSNDIFYEKVVIASGANPFIPPIEGANLNGVMGFKTQIDLEKIISYVENGLKKAVVVGAGAIGIELAQSLKHKGVDVTLVDMASQVLPNLIDNEFAQKVTEEIVKNGIHLVLNSKVEKITGRDNADEVHLDTDEIIYINDSIACVDKSESNISGLVIFATGVVPELSFIKDKKLNIDRQGIIVNEFMETNLKDVYSVGDCVQFKSLITQKVSPGKLATNAVPMAMVLANNLLGKKMTYKGFVNGAATKVYNYFVGGTGLTASAALKEGISYVRGFSQLTTQFPIMPGKKELWVKLLVNKNNHKLIGGHVLSGEPVTALVDLLSFAIQMHASIHDLVELSYSAQPYQSFFPASNVIVMAAEQIINQLE